MNTKTDARETESQPLEQDEIIPEMLKLSPKLSKKINLNELTPEDLTGNEMNPEWESFFSDSTLGKKMVEFGELQQEGADVMHSTFVHLKNFPFFHELSNWSRCSSKRFFWSDNSAFSLFFVQKARTTKKSSIATRTKITIQAYNNILCEE